MVLWLMPIDYVNREMLWLQNTTRPHFYQTRSAWSVDQGLTRKCSAVHNFAPTVTKFCVMWEGLSLPHDTKFGNCRDGVANRRVIFIWSLTHGSSWSGLIKVGPGWFSKMLAVKDDDMSQIWIPVTVLQNKILKDGITACYETWLHEHP